MTKRPSDEELGDQYEAAMEEWYASEDAALWESTIGDGIEDEPEWRALLPAPDEDSGSASRRR